MTPEMQLSNKMDSNPLRNRRHEKFALALFQGMNQREAAIEAGYSIKTADAIASRLLKNVKISNRVLELQKASESTAVMTVMERKERLSEIARARLTDFVECGADGAWINVGLDSTHSAALQEVTSRTEYNEDGASPITVTKLKLHDPVKSISELNKMEQVYETAGVTIDNRTVNIIVRSKESKERLERLLSGKSARIEKETVEVKELT